MSAVHGIKLNFHFTDIIEIFKMQYTINDVMLE